MRFIDRLHPCVIGVGCFGHPPRQMCKVLYRSRLGQPSRKRKTTVQGPLSRDALAKSILTEHKCCDYRCTGRLAVPQSGDTLLLYPLHHCTRSRKSHWSSRPTWISPKGASLWQRKITAAFARQGEPPLWHTGDKPSFLLDLTKEQDYRKSQKLNLSGSVFNDSTGLFFRWRLTAFRMQWKSVWCFIL